MTALKAGMSRDMGTRPLLREIRKNRAFYLMLAPYFILFFLFTVVPVLMSMALSLTYFNMLEMPTFIGWDNYLKLLFKDDIFTIALQNTLIFAVVTGPVSISCACCLRGSLTNLA